MENLVWVKSVAVSSGGGGQNPLYLRATSRPLVLQLEKRLRALLVIFQLSFEESPHVDDALALHFSDVLHASDHILVGLFVLDFLRSQFFFDAIVLFLGLLHFGKRGIVGQPPAVQLLASILLKSDERIIV